MSNLHKEPIDRKNPTFFLFLVDQSGSMSEPLCGQAGKTKAQGVADAINRLIQGLVFRCSMGNEIADRYYMGLIGYNNSINVGFGVFLSRSPEGTVLYQPRPSAWVNDRRLNDQPQRGGPIECCNDVPRPTCQGRPVGASHGMSPDCPGRWPGLA